MQTNNGIHCKVSCNDQFRRFLFTGTEFTSLFQQVGQVLALENEFVLKYSDNEGDLITISTDEELAYALDIAKGAVLRLVVDQPASESVVEQPLQWRQRGGKCRRGGFHAQGGMHERPYGGRHNFEGRQRCWELKKAKMIQKRDLFQSLLAEFPTNRSLTPDEASRQRMLQSKLTRIESHLARWDSWQGKKRGKMLQKMG